MSQESLNDQHVRLDEEPENQDTLKYKRNQNESLDKIGGPIQANRGRQKNTSSSRRKYPLRKRDKESEEQDEAQKQRVRTNQSKEDTPLQSYVKMVDYLKKIQWDEANLQNKMNPINALTANCFWFIVSAQFFSYNFWNKKSPKDVAFEYMHKINKIPVGIPCRVLKSLRTEESLEFETKELKEASKPITEKLNNLLPPQLSTLRTSSYEKGSGLTTCAQDDYFRSSTRAWIFNYIRQKMKTSEKWSGALSPKLKCAKDLAPRIVKRYPPLKIEESSSDEADPEAVLFRHRKKSKKTRARKNKVQVQVFEEEQGDSNQNQAQVQSLKQGSSASIKKQELQLAKDQENQSEVFIQNSKDLQNAQNAEKMKNEDEQGQDEQFKQEIMKDQKQNCVNERSENIKGEQQIIIVNQIKTIDPIKAQINQQNVNLHSNSEIRKGKEKYSKQGDVYTQIIEKQVYYGQEQLLLDSLMHLPLDKVISILQSMLPKNQFPEIVEPFLQHPVNDPLQLIYKLHPQEEKYLDYLKKNRMKMLKKKQCEKEEQKKHLKQKQSSLEKTIKENQIQEEIQEKNYRNCEQKNQNHKEHAQIKQIQQDDIQSSQFEDAKCQICTDGDYTEDNLIVFCSKCNISLHQRCVGLTKVPAQSWICEVCQAFGPSGINVPCPLCNVKGGALKRTIIHIDTQIFKDNNPYYHQFAKNCPFNKQKQQYIITENDENLQEDQLFYDYFRKSTHLATLKPVCHYVWVHYVCAIWIPECYFEQKNGLINVKGVENVDKKRFKMECQICKRSKNGACVKCQEPECQKYYHPECARKKKIYMEQLNLQKLKYLIFCSEHEPLKLMRQIQYKKKKSRDQIIKFCRMIEKYVQTYKIAYLPFKLQKNILTINNSSKAVPVAKNQTNTNQNLIDKKNLNLEYNQISDDESFVKTIINNLQKNRNIVINIQKIQKNNQNLGYKLISVQQPSKRAMRKSLSRYDEFWVKLSNGESGERNYQRYLQIVKQNSRLRHSIEKLINGSLLGNIANVKITHKKVNKGGRKKKNYQQAQIEQEGGIFCICRRPYKGETDMFECQTCSQWYHFDCIGFIGGEQKAQEMEFHCMKCMKYENPLQTSKRVEKYRNLFKPDSKFLNFRPDTPSLQSEKEQQMPSVFQLNENRQDLGLEKNQTQKKQFQLKNNEQANKFDKKLQELALPDQISLKQEKMDEQVDILIEREIVITEKQSNAIEKKKMEGILCGGSQSKKQNKSQNVSEELRQRSE